MQIWFFIQWLTCKILEGSLWLCQMFISWFILGRGCNRCKHRKYNTFWGYNECTLGFMIEGECQCSITRKHFEREVQNG